MSLLCCMPALQLMSSSWQIDCWLAPNMRTVGCISEALLQFYLSSVKTYTNECVFVFWSATILCSFCILSGCDKTSSGWICFQCYLDLVRNLGFPICYSSANLHIRGESSEEFLVAAKPSNSSRGELSASFFLLSSFFLTKFKRRSKQSKQTW